MLGLMPPRPATTARSPLRGGAATFPGSWLPRTRRSDAGCVTCRSPKGWRLGARCGEVDAPWTCPVTGSIFSFSSAGGGPPRAAAARAATPVPPQPPPSSPPSPPPPTLVSPLLAPALTSRSAGAAASLCIVGIFACGLGWWHAPVTAEPLSREALREDMSNASATTEFCAASCGTVAIHSAARLGLLDEMVLGMPRSTMATM
mmetsp:Transcript_76291/g.111746  ORF Transcript_76291/g.111746 Transcript_76291/m.111746 type:complete len:203 (-) Transcript_76291:19-627(-)